MKSLPLAQWLLCLWQARAVGSSWWCFLLIILGIVAVRERSSACFLTRRRVKKRVSSWPELVKAGISLVITMYVLMVSFSELWNGKALISILLVVAVWGMLDYSSAGVSSVWVTLLGFGVAIWFSIIRIPTQGIHMSDSWVGWVQLILLVQNLLSGNIIETWRWLRVGFALSICLVLGITEHHKAERVDGLEWVLLLILPCVCIREKQLISECIVPTIEEICHVGLYTLQDPQKASAKMKLLKEQRQELLFYVMAWSINLGFLSQLEPTILLLLLALGVLVSLRQCYPADEKNEMVRTKAENGSEGVAAVNSSHVIQIDRNIMHQKTWTMA